MRQRKFEIVISENLERDDGVESTVSIRIGSAKEGHKVIECKCKDAELTEEHIAAAVNKLMHYMLPEIPDEEVNEPKPVAVFKRTPDGKFVPG